jgi:hypothetical protein
VRAWRCEAKRFPSIGPTSRSGCVRPDSPHDTTAPASDPMNTTHLNVTVASKRGGGAREASITGDQPPDALPSSRRAERVTEKIKAADITLTAAEVEEIDARSVHLTVTGGRGSGHESYR